MPRTHRRELPPCAARARAAMHLAVQSWPRCHDSGAVEVETSTAPPTHAIPRGGELCPETIGSDTSCHELVSTPGGVARRRIKERSSHETPADDARGAVRARAASLGLPRRLPGAAHPRCLPYDERTPRGRNLTPQAVGNLWRAGTTPLLSPRIPSAFDLPEGFGDPTTRRMWPEPDLE